MKAIAAIQPGYGNTAPVQLELDPCIAQSDSAGDTITSLIVGHFALGGTLFNVNIIRRPASARRASGSLAVSRSGGASEDDLHLLGPQGAQLLEHLGARLLPAIWRPPYRDAAAFTAAR